MNFLLEKLTAFVSKTSTMIMLTIGMSVIIGSVGVSIMLIPTKLLAVIAASVGTFMGTTIIASSMTKVMSQKLNDERQEKEKEIRARVALENGIAKSAEIENERNNLQNEINHLKNMKLDVNSISRIMDLGVAKADMTFRDFKKVMLSKESSIISRDEIKEYIGLLECSYTAKLGVDLLKLKFSQTKDGYIEVSGLKSETLGILNRDITWLMKEVRTLKTNSKWLPESYEIEENGKNLIEQSDIQAKQIDAMIEKGANLKHFDDYIIKLAKDFIILLLVPLQKEVIFVEQENYNAKELVHFLTENNNLIEEKMRILHTQSNNKILEMK